MQSVAMTLNHLTGSGWKDTRLTFSCNENIGLEAGRDIFATARGTAITAMRKAFLTNGTHATLVIDGKVIINISYSNHKFEKSEPHTL